MAQLKGSLGADGKIWCIPCDYTNRPPTGGSRFGWRTHPFGGYKHHNGVDLSGYQDMPLYATKDGKITLATYNSSAGNYIILDHDDGTKSVYMHMGEAVGTYPNKDQEEEKKRYASRWLVKVGQKVRQGEQVGHMGSTGCSTGTHLHFGVQKKGHNDPDSGSYVDPMLYIGGLECDLGTEASSYITDDLRIKNVELPGKSDWKPKVWNSGSDEGSPKMTMIKRHAFLGSSLVPVFNTYGNHVEACTGYGVFGINSNLKSIPSVEKDAVMSTYATKQPDGSFGEPYKLGALTEEGQELVATYIYSKLSAAHWSHNAILGLLANLRAESGLNPARWEQDVNWGKFDTDADGELDIKPTYSDGSPVKDYSGNLLTAGMQTPLRGFGLIQWTPWSNFFNAVPDGFSDPYDIDAQIQGIINYHNSSYRDGRNGSVGDTYEDNLKNDKLWGTHPRLMEYCTSDGNDYYFPIDKDEFIKGEIKTSVNLSNRERVYVLTVAYTYNAERPAVLSASLRCSYADMFLDMFGEDGNVKLFTPSIETDEFWEIAKTKCNYVSGSIIKNNESYCISRGNEILSQIYSDNKKDLIIPKDTKDWYAYNKNKLKYECSALPRVGSIIYYNSAKGNKGPKMAIVESVISTHCVRVSSYDDTEGLDDEERLKSHTILNNNHNWQEDKGQYIFEGFIHLIHDLNIKDYVESEKDEKEEDIDELITGVSKDKDSNLVIDVNNKSVQDKYVTLMFALENMKHINGISITYKAFKDNSETKHSGNELSVCLAQQVWNCIELGPLINTKDDTNEEVNLNLRKVWPFTYFPYKQAETKKDIFGNDLLDDNGQKINIPETEPYRYHAPYPTGNLTVAKINITQPENKVKDVTKRYDLYKYRENNVIYDAYDRNGKLDRMVRNHPGYLCLMVKAPKLEEDHEKDEYTHTRVILKEILIDG